MASLIEKMIKSGGSKHATAFIASESPFIGGSEHFVPTNIPALNIALSGDLTRGFGPGVTVFAGDSSTGKTLMCWLAASAFQRKYEEGVVVFYDSEFGTPDEYMESLDIDKSRVLHVPVYDVEQLKFDMTKRLDAIEPGEKVFFLLDSLGQIASKKEVEDAENEKSVADMTRAKAIKSFFRIVTNRVVGKSSYFFAINHTYQETGLFPKTIMSGGKGVKLSANNVIFTSKSQEKEGSELAGFNINLGVDKSRFVKEKSRIPLTLMFDGGFKPMTGLVDIAIDLGFIVKPSNGYYVIVDKETGEELTKKMRRKEIETPQVLIPLLKKSEFRQAIRDHFQIAGGDKKTLSSFDISEVEDE